MFTTSEIWKYLKIQVQHVFHNLKNSNSLENMLSVVGCQCLLIAIDGFIYWVPLQPTEAILLVYEQSHNDS